MATDFRMDFLTGDLIAAPNNDVSLITGLYVLYQRVHIRLMIQKGAWILDPTDGELGSRLPALLRVGEDMALAEAELRVREALEPMEDIQVLEVAARINNDDARKMDIDIRFQPVSTDPSIRLRGGESQAITITIPPTTGG